MLLIVFIYELPHTSSPWSLGAPVPQDTRDPYLSDIPEIIPPTQEIELPAVTRIAVEPSADAELRIMYAVIDQPASVRSVHLPDQRPVQEELMHVLRVAVLPGDVVPLGIADTDLGRFGNDALGPCPRVQVFPGVVGALKVDARGHAAVWRIVIRQIQFPYSLLGVVVGAADMPEVEGSAVAVHRTSSANPRFHGPLFRTIT